MASPSNRIETGTFRANGGAAVLCDLPGFRPLSIDIFGANGSKMEWHAGMDAGTAWKTVIGGTRSLVASPGGITATSTGFQLGTDATLNTGTQVITFRVHG